ncbi:OsmC family protein [Tenacibaculum insulae]|uniref:OsmC family protein n=1 Tax=Tenacibaculum insulae TaxID=2029677 RepID=UPI003AB1BEAA
MTTTKTSSKTVLSNQNYFAEATMLNYSAVIDVPVSKGGNNKGPTPVEYLLTAIGSCVAITIRMYAERKKWDVGKITVNVVQKEALTSEGIKKTLVEEISFENDVTDVQREKLLTIAGKCPVAKMVKGETPITSIIK